MTIHERFSELAATEFERGLEWKLNGSREMAATVAMLATAQLRFEGYRYSAEEREWSSGVPVLVIRAEGPSGGGSIGIIVFVDAPGGSVWLRVPSYRGGGPESDWRPDVDGRLFAHFLSLLRQEYQRLGYTSVSSTLRARSILDAAYQQLAVADDASAWAAIGNSCRAAVIALADELYETYMLPADAASPKTDDAPEKLNHCIRHYLAGSSDRYREGLQAIVRDTWTMVSAFLHRKHPSQEETQICLDQTSALIDGMARLALRNRPHD